MPTSASDANDSRSVAPGRYFALLAIAAVGCLADLLTKYWVFHWMGMPDPQAEHVWWLWEGFIGIETSTNPGALFGLGAGYTWLFALLSAIAAVGVLAWVFLGGAARDRLLLVALGLILAGILGNLYDRLGLWIVPGTESARLAEVRDWILFQFGDFKWPNFNLADTFLVCGAGLLVLHAFRAESAERAAKYKDRPSADNSAKVDSKENER